MLSPKQLFFLLSLLFPRNSEEAFSQEIIPNKQPLTQFLQISSVQEDESSIVQLIYPKADESIINTNLLLLLEKTIKELQKNYSFQSISLESQQKIIILSIKVPKENIKKITEVLINLGSGNILGVTWDNNLQQSIQTNNIEFAQVPSFLQKTLNSMGIEYTTQNYVSELPSSSLFKYFLIISEKDYINLMHVLTFDDLQ